MDHQKTFLTWAQNWGRGLHVKMATECLIWPDIKFSRKSGWFYKKRHSLVFFGPIDLNSFANVGQGLYLDETGSFLVRLVDIRAEILA